ncbi:hypothetical protein L596_005698 [Steinernema carpocapsae]|uniref:Methyltransferase domain-containing protein n=1 Tax=Steinernema carpocapsae TaxID=34508 RepID=A0A4U8V1A9_STECR|nr:hypothetical protein L596_005698 [Steinernema carpocapsae]
MIGERPVDVVLFSSSVLGKAPLSSSAVSLIVSPFFIFLFVADHNKSIFKQTAMGSLNRITEMPRINMLEVARQKVREQDFGTAVGAYISFLMSTSDQVRFELVDEFQGLLLVSYRHMQAFYFEGLYDVVTSLYPNHMFPLIFWSDHYYATRQFLHAVTLSRKILGYRTEPEERCRLIIRIQNAAEQSFDAWHFCMINDQNRNAAFKLAVQDAIVINPAAERAVLDIGCGTGLLSAYASKGYANTVLAIEENPTMQAIAETVFRNNCCENVTLMKAHSSQVNLSDAEKCDILVTETLDCAAFGEGILSTVYDAHCRLLKPNPLVIPSQVDLFIFVAHNPEFLKHHVHKTVNGTILSKYAAHPCLKSDDPYWSCYLDDLDMETEFLSEATAALSVDFQDVAYLKRLVEEGINQIIEVDITKTGEASAIVACWRSDLFGGTTISTFPSEKGCWEQAVFPFPKPLSLVEDQKLEVTMTLEKNAIRFYTELSQSDWESSICTVKDEDLMKKLNSNHVPTFFQKATVGLPTTSRILDMTNLPTVSRVIQDRFPNCYSYANGEDHTEVGRQFDLKYDEEAIKDGCDYIIHWPVNSSSMLDHTAIVMLADIIKSCPNASIIPSKLSIVGQLIESDQMKRKTRLDLTAQHGVDISPLAEFNLFHYEEIPSKRFKGKALSEETVLRNIDFTDSSNEPQEVKITATKAGRAVGVLYHIAAGDYASKEEFHCSMVMLSRPTNVIPGSEITLSSYFVDHKLVFAHM